FEAMGAPVGWTCSNGSQCAELAAGAGCAAGAGADGAVDGSADGWTGPRTSPMKVRRISLLAAKSWLQAASAKATRAQGTDMGTRMGPCVVPLRPGSERLP